MNLSKFLREEKESYYSEILPLVDKQIYQIMLDLEKNRTEKYKNYDSDILSYEIIGIGEVLKLPIIEHFEKKIETRESYLELLKLCNEKNFKLEIQETNVGYQNPDNYHILEPTLETFKIVMTPFET
tara:strand:+ start:76 stop:456 length:381 start_codon:yes stop_codon:yes gene_type:complete